MWVQVNRQADGSRLWGSRVWKPCKVVRRKENHSWRPVWAGRSGITKGHCRAYAYGGPRHAKKVAGRGWRRAWRLRQQTRRNSLRACPPNLFWFPPQLVAKRGQIGLNVMLISSCQIQ